MCLRSSFRFLAWHALYIFQFFFTIPKITFFVFSIYLVCIFFPLISSNFFFTMPKNHILLCYLYIYSLYYLHPNFLNFFTKCPKIKRGKYKNHIDFKQKNSENVIFIRPLGPSKLPEYTRILKIFCFSSWHIAKFGYFLSWMIPIVVTSQNCQI